MTLEVARRLADDDRTWETVIVEEDAGGSFNGGTITEPLEITTPDEVGLTVNAGDSGSTPALVVNHEANADDYVAIVRVLNGDPTEIFRIESSGEVRIRLMQPDVGFKVLGPLGGTILRVDPDGALHGKTGQALTFDL